MVKRRSSKTPRASASSGSGEGIGGLELIEDSLRKSSVMLDCLRYTLSHRHEALDSELDLQWSDAALVIDIARDFVMEAHTTTLEAMNLHTAPSPGNAEDATC
jgi:hypothetical protein